MDAILDSLPIILLNVVTELFDRERKKNERKKNERKSLDNEDADGDGNFDLEKKQ